MGNHWYDKAGKPVHTIIGTNGKVRERTLRDVRKTGDANSVTGFLDILDKPQLVIWSNNQILEAAIKFKPGHLVGISEEVTNQWKHQVLEESKKIGKDAADIGSKIHNALEIYFKTGKVTDYHAYIHPIVDLLKETFGETDWVAEKSFYHNAGFGGTVDLHSPNKKIVIDFKTKKDKAFTKGKMGYDNHMMQLGAYGMGLGFDSIYDEFLQEKVLKGSGLEGEYYNLFISSETPGIILLEEWDIKDIRRGAKMFLYLVDYWKLSKQYNPEEVNTSKVNV